MASKSKKGGNPPFRLWLFSANCDKKRIQEILKRIFKNMDVLDTGREYLAILVIQEELKPEEVLEMLETEAMVRVTIAISRYSEDIEEVPLLYKDALKLFAASKQLGISQPILVESELLLPLFIYNHTLKSERPSKPLLDDEVLLQTAKVFFECSLNVTDAAQKLFVHRNTLLYRLTRIQTLTGYDLRNFEHAVNFYLLDLQHKMKGKRF